MINMFLLVFYKELLVHLKLLMMAILLMNQFKILFTKIILLINFFLFKL